MSKKDTLFTLTGAIFILAGLVGFFLLKEDKFLTSLLVITFGGMIGLGFICTTSKFKSFQDFMRKVKMEFFHIIWPTGNSAFKSFLVVVVFAFVFAGVIWGLDSELAILYKAFLTP